ncbi:hypothetical protein AOA59_23800 [Pseudomonas sp. 2822-15]|nr:hypothetical protein AOA59_23800 [Pseudomonas sp. 2822-15]
MFRNSAKERTRDATSPPRKTRPAPVQGCRPDSARSGGRGRHQHVRALGLGYENASGFITMFRKAVGQPPARYLADRSGASSATAPAAIALRPDS